MSKNKTLSAAKNAKNDEFSVQRDGDGMIGGFIPT